MERREHLSWLLVGLLPHSDGDLATWLETPPNGAEQCCLLLALAS